MILKESSTGAESCPRGLEANYAGSCGGHRVCHTLRVYDGGLVNGYWVRKLVQNTPSDGAKGHTQTTREVAFLRKLLGDRPDTYGSRW